MKLLIIEDNQLIAEALCQGLKSSYSLDRAATGKDGLDLASETVYDLIILDLNLPDMHGKQVCEQLRKQKVVAPIIVLTGSVSVNDKVALLDIGADDYLTKPFSLEEVRARIRAVLRRTTIAPPSETTIVAGIMALDPAQRTVHRDGQLIELRRKEFDILEYLMSQPGKTMTRAMIVAHIWDMSDNLWANVVDVHIKHLRDKIDRPFGSHLIKTVHGVGYKFDIS